MPELRLQKTRSAYEIFDILPGQSAVRIDIVPQCGAVDPASGDTCMLPVGHDTVCHESAKAIWKRGLTV